MVQPTLMYGRKYQKGMNWITATAMIAFHIGAVAAFFFITTAARMLTALVLYFVGGMLGIGMAYHRLLTHRGYKTYQVGRVLPHLLRHARARRRSDFLGRDAPHPPSEVRP